MTSRPGKWTYGHGTTRRTRPCSSVEHATELRRLFGGWVRVRIDGKWQATAADDPLLRPWWKRAR